MLTQILNPLLNVDEEVKICEEIKCKSNLKAFHRKDRGIILEMEFLVFTIFEREIFPKGIS